MSKKEIRVLELAMARKARQSELQDFINNSSFQAVMRKTVAFLTDDRSDRIQLKISTGDASFTDGRAITVGMEDYFFSPEFSRYEWVSIFKALLAHEVQHINSSNFKDIKDIMKKYTAMMTGKGIPDQLLGKIAKDMLNIMEDGRIENIIVHKLPGYKMPLILMNQGTADLSTLEEKADTPGEEFLDFVNSSLCYVKTGRRPYGISVYAGTRFEKEYEAVLPYFDLAVDARSSKDCKDLCLKVLKSTADYFAELLKAEIDQQKAAGNSGGKGDPGEGDGSGDYEYTSNGECEYNDSPNGSVSERAAKEAEGGKPGKKSDKKAGKKDEDKDDKGKKRGKGDKEGKDGNGGKDGKEDGDADGKDGENGDSANKTGRNALRMPRDPSSRSNTENWTDDFSGDGAEDYDVRELTADELQALRQGVMDELDAVEKENKVEKSKEEVTREKIAERYSGEYTRSFLELFPVIPNTALPSEVERAGRKLENDVERVLRVKRTEKRNTRHPDVLAVAFAGLPVSQLQGDDADGAGIHREVGVVAAAIATVALGSASHSKGQSGHRIYKDSIFVAMLLSPQVLIHRASEGVAGVSHEETLLGLDFSSNDRRFVHILFSPFIFFSANSSTSIYARTGLCVLTAQSCQNNTYSSSVVVQPRPHPVRPGPAVPGHNWKCSRT